MAMKMINRCAILVMPAQPFLDWLHRVDPSSAHLSLADLRQEPAIYLLPECESKEEALEGLRGGIRKIFEEQLNGWYRVPSAWPEQRDLHTFLRWFECSFHSMIFDLARDRLRHEES
jgi:hypothetical protein